MPIILNGKKFQGGEFPRSRLEGTFCGLNSVGDAMEYEYLFVYEECASALYRFGELTDFSFQQKQGTFLYRLV